MSVQVNKWGNALGVRIPSFIVNQINLHAGDRMEFELDQGKVILKKIDDKAILDHLLAQITQENCHSETYWGEPKGNEVW